MKKKKVLLALIVIAIVASIGALGYLALSYFSSSARSSNAGGELSIDYLVSEKDVVEEDTQSAAKTFSSGSKNGSPRTRRRRK